MLLNRLAFRSAAHRLLNKVVSVQTLAEKGPVDWHPGALKYLKEKGLVK